MTTKTDKADVIRAELVAEILAEMQSNPGTWSARWSQTFADGMPSNVKTGAMYRGGNVWWLALEQMSRGYSSPVWGTYKQWKAVGAQVRRGEKSTPVLFWKRYEKHAPDHPKADAEGNVRTMFARTYNVFNLAQVDVMDTECFERHAQLPDQPAAHDVDDIDRARAWFDPIPVTIGVGRPSYSPAEDIVRMPDLGSFDAAEHYYSTLAHEVTHWTGHKSRLNRPRHESWGDDAYAFEELVAELGAVITCAALGIEHETRADHVAYLASWIAQLEDHPQAFWSAATKASAAFEHLTSYQHAADIAPYEPAEALV